MTILVAWSAGLDSTALIHHHLNEGRSVEAAYVRLENNKTKADREQAAIAKMTPIFERTGRFKLLQTSTVDLYGHNSLLGLKQPPVWILPMLYYCHSQIEEVNFAYVLNDCAISYLDEIKAIWDSYRGLADGSPPSTLPPLKFPFSKRHKEVLWASLPVELREHITWCESPETEDLCGTCTPCKRLKYYEMFDGMVAAKQPTTNLDTGKKLQSELKLVGGTCS